jgi:glycosyltransferase involved in cell wall biosynthesis
MELNHPKILLIAQHYFPDLVSTGLHMTELTTKWKELYPEISMNVLTSNNTAKVKHEKVITNEVYKGVQIRRVKSVGKQHGNLINRVIYAIGFILKALFYLLKNGRKYDIYLITTNPPFLGILILVIHKLFKKPYIIISYDIYPQILNSLGILKSDNILYKLWYKLNTVVYKNSEKVVSIGDDMTEILLSQIGVTHKNKIELIYNWSDKNSVRYIAPEENKFLSSQNLLDKKVVLYSGTFGTTHNIEDILQASLDLKDNIEIVFLFIGGGAKEKVVLDHIKNNNSQNLILLPFQPFEILSQTLSSATISIVCLDEKFTGLSVPSKTYGLMAAKQPILALMSNNAEIARTINKFNFGKVWNESSHVKLSSVILEMLSDKENLEFMATNGYDAFIDNFNIDISVKKYNDLVHSILY